MLSNIQVGGVGLGVVDEISLSIFVMVELQLLNDIDSPPKQQLQLTRFWGQHLSTWLTLYIWYRHLPF